MTALDRRHGDSDEEAATPGEVRRWRAFALLAIAYFMTIVDLTIVNVALPTIGRKPHFPESDLQWVVTAYGLTFGGFLLLGPGPRPARPPAPVHDRAGDLHRAQGRRGLPGQADSGPRLGEALVRAGRQGPPRL